MTQKVKQKEVARWDFGTIAVDIIGGVGREVARYWFHGDILYVGFVVDRVQGHAVLFFAGMTPYVFYVPDLRPHDTIPCRFNDWSEVTKAIAEFEESKGKGGVK